MNQIILAVDAMGGDHAPLSVIKGAARAAEAHENLHYIFYGDEARIKPITQDTPALSGRYSIVHTDSVVASSEKPSVALKKGGNTSMRMAIDAVLEKKAAGIISAGNTGALMALSKFVLRTYPGIDRPAIASLFPSKKGDCVLLDLGANVECDANNLFQFALLGEGFAKAVLGIENPKVGILNVGSEEIKGHEDLRAAAALIRESGIPANFHGFVEGYDIAGGTVDVVVTDGFTGNVALKTAEGLATLFQSLLKEAFTRNLISKLGYLLVKSSLQKSKDVIDPRKRGGAMLLGLNGVVVKCHGSADEVSFSSAVKIAYSIIHSRLNEKIIEELNLVAQSRAQNKTIVAQ